MEMILETNGLTKKYSGQYAVNDVNLSIPAGKVYGFVGPNGAGKTTAIRMILDLVQPTEGDITIFGQSLKNSRIDILRKIGSLVENPSYYGHLDAQENLEVYRILLGAPKYKIKEVLDTVNLTYAAKKKVKNYSLGMKQRLGIAISLLGDPELLILDEPTNGLDPSGIREIRTLIRNLSRRAGKSVLISSHLLSEIDQIADFVGIISDGRLIYQNDIQSLRSRSRTMTIFQVEQIERAQKILLQHDIESDIKEDGLNIRVIQKYEVAEAVRLLAGQQIDIYGVTQKTLPLEQIFLDIIKEAETHV